MSVTYCKILITRWVTTKDGGRMWVAWREHFLWSFLNTADSIAPVSLLESARFLPIIFLIIWRWWRTLAGENPTARQVRPYINMHLTSIKPMFAPGWPPTPPLHPSPTKRFTTTASTLPFSDGSLLVYQQHCNTQRWLRLRSISNRYSVQERILLFPTPQVFLILEQLTRIYDYILMRYSEIQSQIQIFLCLSINQTGAPAHSSGVGTVLFIMLLSLCSASIFLSCLWLSLVEAVVCMVLFNVWCVYTDKYMNMS